MSDLHPALADFKVLSEFSVLWGDHDAFNHVNNVAYLRWFETARVDYLRRLNLFPDMPPKGLGPIVASIKCDYRVPLNYPDTVLIGTRVTRLGNTSFDISHTLISRTLDRVAAECQSTMVVFDYATGRPAKIPADIREVIQALDRTQ